jgi:UDP-N-acetylmuramoyl-L-alanyl-D-glutamate--2,6-diaminopimelate ligase
MSRLQSQSKKIHYLERVYKDLYKIIADVKGLTCNSKAVELGECFFALRGLQVDASHFIQEALAKGAKYVVTENLQIPNYGNKVLYVTSVKDALSYCAKRFYSELPKYKIAITGTNGKTSTAEYCREILELCSLKAASIGTIGICSKLNIPENLQSLANLTSNELLANYQILAGLRHLAVDYISMEVSSIGLDQNRFAGIEFSTAGFVSFSSDHLDYHKSLKDYLRTKLMLLKNCPSDYNFFISKDVVQQIYQLNMQDYLRGYKLIGQSSDSDVYIKLIDSTLDGQQIAFTYNDENFSFFTPIIGKFQAYNLIFAIFLTHSCGLELGQIIQIIGQVNSVKGRMQKVHDPEKNRYIFVDYAHNPDALKKVLLELNILKKPNAKIFTVFGCGGDRDKFKRAIMGLYACQMSYQVVVTDDNPRNENPEEIRREIINGIDKDNYIEIPDRKEAIKYVLNKMRDYDILLVAGKGHEEYQIYKDQRSFFSDFETIKLLLT